MFVELVIAAGIGAISLLLARRELGIYRARKAADSDVFVYSKWRLARRLTGIAVLASTAITLVAWVLVPPTTAGGASAYITLFMCEVAALFVLAIVDLIETTRTARVGKLPTKVARAVAQMAIDASDPDAEKENAPATKATGAPKKNKKKATAGRGRRKRSRARRPR